MNEKTFTHLLNQLEDADWQAVVDGQSILMMDDLRLAIGPANASNAIIRAPQESHSDATTLKQESLADAAVLLANYYLTHPLTLAGFNHQVAQLIEQQGAAAFAAPSGHIARYTLFVDGGEVVAEPPDSPRHRYGVFCELERPLPDSEIETHVRKWLARGDAHDRYLGMNVCRYNC